MPFSFSHSSAQVQKAGRAVTLLEILVVLGILGILLAVISPYFGGQRARQAANTAVELTQALLDRAQEEARAGGYPIESDLKNDGLSTVANDSSGENGTLVLRLSRRLSAGSQAKVLSNRELPNSGLLLCEPTNLGQLSATQQGDFLGVWVDLLRKTESGEAVVTSIPVDVNGEFVLFGQASQATLSFIADGHSRSLSLERSGAHRED